MSVKEAIGHMGCVIIAELSANNWVGVLSLEQLHHFKSTL